MRKRDLDRLTLSAARARADAAVAEQELVKLRLQVEQLRAAQQQQPAQQQPAQPPTSVRTDVAQQPGTATNPILANQRPTEQQPAQPQRSAPRSRLEILHERAAAGDPEATHDLQVRERYAAMRELARVDPRGRDAVRARLFATQNAASLDRTAGEPVSLFPRRTPEPQGGTSTMGGNNGGGNSAA